MGKLDGLAGKTLLQPGGDDGAHSPESSIQNSLMPPAGVVNCIDVTVEQEDNMSPYHVQVLWDGVLPQYNRDTATPIAHHYTQTFRKKLQMRGDGSQSPRGAEFERHVKRGMSPNACSENVRAALTDPDVGSTSPRFGSNSPRVKPKDMISLAMESTEAPSPRGKKHDEHLTHTTHYFLNGEVHLKSDLPIEEMPARRHYRASEYSPNRSEGQDSPTRLTSALSSEAHNHRYKDPDRPVPHSRKMFLEKLETRRPDEQDRWQTNRKMKGTGSPNGNIPKRDLEGVGDLFNHHGTQELVADRERRLEDDVTFRRACEVNSKYSKVTMNLTDAILLQTNKTNSSNVADC